MKPFLLTTRLLVTLLLARRLTLPRLDQRPDDSVDGVFSVLRFVRLEVDGRLVHTNGCLRRVLRGSLSDSLHSCKPSLELDLRYDGDSEGDS